jgi:hypothetical protein
LYIYPHWNVGLHTNNQHSDPHVGPCDVGPRATHLLGIIVVCLHGTLDNTLYWVSLLVYVPRTTLYWVLLLLHVVPRAIHPYSGYRWCLGKHTLLGIVVGLCGVLLLAMLCLGQHTLLGIVVGLWEASANTLYGVGLLLWVM